MKGNIFSQENIGFFCTVCQTIIGIIALFNESGATIWIVLFIASLISNAFISYEYTKYKKLYILLYGNPYFNAIKYLIKTRKRKCKNDFRLTSLDVNYTFSDNSKHFDMLDNTIEYHLKGKVLSPKAECIALRLCLNKSESREKIKISGHDNISNSDVSVQDIYPENGYMIYKVPFVGQQNNLADIDYIVTINWNEFSGKKITDQIILDPFNYAKEINGDINIRIYNSSDNFKIAQSLIRLFDRKKLVCSESFAFSEHNKEKQIFSHTIKEGDFNEHTVLGISYGKDVI